MVSAPRQNGKNGIVEIRELFGVVELGERILHSAHEVKTARKAFLRLCEFFEDRERFPELAGLVSAIRRTNGQEAILLNNGGSVEFLARSKRSGRGYTADVLVFDEAQDLDEEAHAALLPTVSSSPLRNPQRIYLGTPPSTTRGEVFAKLRDDALSGKSRRLSYFEWSAPAGADLDDRAVWRKANPALETRLMLETVEDERASMSDERFARERLGMWSEAVSDSPIDADTWTRLEDNNSVFDGAPSIGVDVSPDRSHASVSVAGVRGDGFTHVELVDNRGSAAWVPEFVARMVKKHGAQAVVIDKGSQAGSLIPALEGKGVPLTLVGAREMGRACGSFFDLVMSDGLRHLGQPTLTLAVREARKRSIGAEGLWGWNRKNTAADITPLVSVTLAVFGLNFSGVSKKKPVNRFYSYS
ncbi:MAG: hypothetical protein WAN89_02795 [Lawsonella sp.]